MLYYEYFDFIALLQIIVVFGGIIAIIIGIIMIIIDFIIKIIRIIKRRRK